MSIDLAEHELAGQCREATGAPTPSASGPTNLGRSGRNAQSRSPRSFGFDPIEGLATGSVSWLDAQPPFDPGNGGESQGFRVFGSNEEQGNVIRIESPVVKQLRLTPMQERRLVPVLRAERLRIQAIKNDQSLSKSQQLRRLRAVQNRSNRKLRVILTRSQFRQLQVNRQQRAQLMAAIMQTTKTH